MEAFDLLAPRAARYTDAVVALTDVEAAFFSRLGASRVRLIPPAVRSTYPALSHEQLTSARRRLGVLEGPLVICVGRSDWGKGHPFAADVITSVRDHLPDATLLLIGVRTDHPLGRLPGVVCTGWLSQQTVQAAYGCADVTFVPSRYDSFSRVVIEAWAHGCPVVVTDGVGLAPLVARSGGPVVRFGIQRDASDAIIRLLKDKAIRDQIGAAGRALVQADFLLDHVVDQTVTLYRELALVSDARHCG
jgi:phosphatidylinositol alpha-1,6-mannosyltransferase